MIIQYFFIHVFIRNHSGKERREEYKKILKEVYSYFSSKNISHEIIVAENNPTDKTVERMTYLKS